METTPDATPPPVPAPVLPEDTVYEMLSHPARRAILRRLSGGGSLSAGDLVRTGPMRQDAMSKQLAWLARSGLLTAVRDPRFRRRYAYTMVPGVVGRKTDTGWELDFGCCVMRWK